MTTIPYDYKQFKGIFFYFIYSYPEWRNIFLEHFPQEKNNIENLLKEGSCMECHNQVETFLDNTDKDFIIKSINDFIVDKNLVEFDLNKVTAQLEPVVYSGKMERVKISEWNAYCQHLRDINALFREFSLVKNDDETVDVFFL